MLKKNSSPHLVLFDLDGTLADTHDVASTAYLRSAKKHFSLDDVDLDWGHYTSSTATGIAREIAQNRWGRPPHNEEIKGIEHDVLQAVQHASLDATPGSLELIQHLMEDSGYVIGIATGNFRSVAEHTLRSIGLPENISLTTADEHIEREGIISLAVDKAHANGHTSGFSAITYVGDGAWDCRAARSLGHDFIGIGPCPRMGAVAGDRRIQDFTDIRKMKDLLANIIIK